MFWFLFPTEVDLIVAKQNGAGTVNDLMRLYDFGANMERVNAKTPILQINSNRAFMKRAEIISFSSSNKHVLLNSNCTVLYSEDYSFSF